MVFGFLPPVILAAIPTASVKVLRIREPFPGGIFKIKDPPPPPHSNPNLKLNII